MRSLQPSQRRAPAARPQHVHRPQITLRTLRSAPAHVPRAAATDLAPPAETKPAEPAAAATPEEEEPEKARAQLKYQRGSPSKVRRVLALIKGKTYEEALSLLTYSPYRASEKVLEVLMSAAQNAKMQFGMRKSRLYVAGCKCDEGPTLKRFQPRAQGRAYRIRKRTSHISVTVMEADEETIQARRAKKTRNRERREKVLDAMEGAVARPQVVAPPPPADEDADSEAGLQEAEGAAPTEAVGDSEAPKPDASNEA